MRKLMIDSCVFFKMIKFNNIFEEHGLEGLEDYIDFSIKQQKQLEKEIVELMGQAFNEKYKDLSFEQKIVKYKEWSKGECARLKKEISGVDATINNYSSFMSESRIKQLKQQQAEASQALAKITPFEDINDQFDKYREQRANIEAGLVLAQACKGDIKLYVCDYGEEEILSHTKLNMLEKHTEMPDWLDKIDKAALKMIIDNYEDNKNNPHRLMFEEDEVLSLFSKVSLLHLASDKEVDMVEDLAKIYRTEPDDEESAAMDEDINSVGKWGDSCLMATASLAGIVFVTHNAKDFIFKGEKSNFKIREHINMTNNLTPYATDVCAYSTSEYLTGLYHEPEQECMFEITSANSDIFDSQYTISTIEKED